MPAGARRPATMRLSCGAPIRRPRRYGRLPPARRAAGVTVRPPAFGFSGSLRPLPTCRLEASLQGGAPDGRRLLLAIIALAANLRVRARARERAIW